MSKQTATIEGMKCDGCANNVKEKIMSLSGISQVTTDLEKKHAHIEADRLFTMDELNAPLEETSYAVVHVQEEKD